MNDSFAFTVQTREPLGDYRLEIDPRLAEESVLLAVESSSTEVRRSFRQQRDPLYEMTNREEQESRFRELHGRWFVHLRLAESLLQVLADHGTVRQSTSRCAVVAATGAKDELADLHGDQESRGAADHSKPVLVLRLRPPTLCDREALLALLRHELLQVDDMLAPEFGYSRTSVRVTGAPPLESLLQERYRVLWNTTIDGRLAARGQLRSTHEELRRQEFRAAFPMLGEAGDAFFADFFQGNLVPHQELLAFAAAPGYRRGSSVSASGRCALCNLPTTCFYPRPRSLEAAVVASIRQDFPRWEPKAGLCRQCADLYAARAPLDRSAITL
jgi:hypothetical protein